jgi:hypothetical protein
LDEWGHYLHGPDNNAVARDTVVGPPRRFQWQGAILAAFSANDGRLLAKWKLDAMPVFDGMAAANGNLYTTTAGGMIFCHGEKK